MKARATLLSLVLACLGWSQLHAQFISYATASADLDTNNVKAHFLNGGDMFWDLSRPHYQVPKGGNTAKNTIFASAIWIGGLYQNNPRVAAMTYRQHGLDFCPGPLDTINGNKDTATIKKYNNIWKMSSAEVDAFRKSPSAITANIRNWPANGDTAAAYSSKLAPYVDADHDGHYNPAKGDYPLIKGDQALWWVFNDNIEHNETKGDMLGLEVQAMAYAYACTKAPLGNTIFLEYTIINRSAYDYDSVFVGQWTDFDIGGGFDDFCGSDSNRSMYYAYNGDSLDSIYGADVPAQGVVFLNHPMRFFKSYNNDFSNTGNPEQATHYYNYLTGRNKDSSAQTDYSGGPWAQDMFAGDPNISGQVSERSLSDTPGDRKGIGSMGPFRLLSHDTIKLDLAFVTSMGAGNYLKNVTQLKKDVSTIIEGYYKGWDNCYVASVKSIVEPSAIKVYPNPAQTTLYIESTSDHHFQAQLCDLTGRVVVRKSLNSAEHLLDISSVKPGLYFLHLQDGSCSYTEKVQIIH